MNAVRWGIIGAGNVCEVKSAPAMQRVPGSGIVAVMRRNARMAQDYAERHGISRWYSRAEDLLADSEVNAVYIATPPSSHAELTGLAARAGYPIYVEKPMARTYHGSYVDVAKNGGQIQRYDFERPSHIQQPLIEAIVQDLHAGTNACVSTGVSASRTNRVMEWITAS
ncbi:MAG: putative dehydrogenase [Bacteroidetes bacterium HLUCCA01]|nr:MAG: putative dehydrogenase [Bacteroidetes bacterium HLUCCA01]